MASANSVDIAQLRQLLLELSGKQIELRQRFNDYWIDGCTLNSIARQAGIKWGNLKAFLDGRQSLSGGRGLSGLCKLLDCEDLGDEIRALAAQMPHRYLGLSLAGPNVINLIVDLMEAHQTHAKNLTYAEFSNIFGKWSTGVEAGLNGSTAALESLKDEDARVEINAILHSDLAEQVAKVEYQKDAAKNAAGERLRELVEPLAEHYGGKANLTKILGIGSTTLRNAVRGVGSLEHIEELVIKVEKLSKVRPPKVETPEAEPALVEESFLGLPKTLSQSPLLPASVSDAMTLIGGITTEAGVPHVLTEASFQELEQVPLVALRESLRTALRLARLQLNIGSQLKDKTAREILQKEIGLELQELEVAIRLFTFAHPNRLLELYDSQREVWATDKSTPSRKGSK